MLYNVRYSVVKIHVHCIRQLEGKLHTEVHYTSPLFSVLFSFWNKLKLNHLVSKTNTFSVILHLLKFLEHVHKFSPVFRSTQMGACL